MTKTILVLALALVGACYKARPLPQNRKTFSAGSFDRAKRLAEHKVYNERRVTFYCGCSFSKSKTIDSSKCGYKPRKNNIRARRIEWEHVVPASAFGQHRKCWTACKGKSGRECCRKLDKQFREMEGDLLNLVPAVGELNADRSNRPYGEVTGEPRLYGKCDFEVDFNSDIVEPPTDKKGDIARIYLYMHANYPGGLPLSKGDIERYRKWSTEDPEDMWEQQRKTRIIAALK